MNDKTKSVTIIINGAEVETDAKRLTYEELVELAFPDLNDPNVTFVVTYRKGNNPGKPAGTLKEGEDVKIKDGTIFDVTPTTKS